ncbi:hypothetical protein M3J09_005498 [Ascochyta lentis]
MSLRSTVVLADSTSANPFALRIHAPALAPSLSYPEAEN